MGDILDFKKKKTEDFSDEMANIFISQFQDGELGVHMECAEGYTDYEIFEAMLAVAFKFAEEHGITGEAENDGYLN